MQHILIQNSKRYKDPETVTVPEGYTYNAQKGYWVNKKEGSPMMAGPNPPVPNSKKWDRETGEDQKGE